MKATKPISMGYDGYLVRYDGQATPYSIRRYGDAGPG